MKANNIKDLKNILGAFREELPILIENHHQETCAIEVDVVLWNGSPRVILRERHK